MKDLTFHSHTKMVYTQPFVWIGFIGLVLSYIPIIPELALSLASITIIITVLLTLGDDFKLGKMLIIGAVVLAITMTTLYIGEKFDISIVERISRWIMNLNIPYPRWYLFAMSVTFTPFYCTYICESKINHTFTVNHNEICERRMGQDDTSYAHKEYDMKIRFPDWLEVLNCGSGTIQLIKDGQVSKEIGDIPWVWWTRRKIDKMRNSTSVNVENTSEPIQPAKNKSTLLPTIIKALILIALILGVAFFAKNKLTSDEKAVESKQIETLTPNSNK